MSRATPTAPCRDRGVRDGAATPLRGVALSAAPASVSRYERLLAAQARARAGEADGTALGLAGAARWREATFAAPPSFAIRLVEWETPRAVRATQRTANALGLYRMALLVDDARKACAQLDALGLAHSGSVWLDMGPEIPIDGLHAGFFPDPDGACLEWIERPRPRGTG
jgi:hypothetical protein